MSAVNTAHQLSPTGIFYTVSASIFLFMLFECVNFNEKICAGLSLLGKNSFFVYLFHPMAITYLTLLGIYINAPGALIFYALTVLISLAIRVAPQYLWRCLRDL